MSRYFYLLFLLISIHDSFCNIEDHNEYRDLIRSSRQTAYIPRRHIRRHNKAHHQGFRRRREHIDEGNTYDLLQEIDVASFMQNPDYGYIDRHQIFPQREGKNHFRESNYADKRMNEDMMIDNRNRLDREMRQGVALNKLDKFEQMSYNVDNNNQYGKQYEDETTKSTKATSPQTKWVYKGITFPFFSHNKVLRASHKKTKRKYDMYDDRDSVNKDHVQLQSSKYFGKPRSYRMMKRSNAPQCNCEICKRMRSMRKRQAYNSINSRTPEIFSGHGRHARQFNMADEWKDFETDITSEGTQEVKKADSVQSPTEIAQQQLRELSEVEQKIDRVTIKPLIKNVV